jgi:hypothetical protein
VVRVAWRRERNRASPAASVRAQPAPEERLAAQRPSARTFRVAPSCRVARAAS